MKEYIKTKSKLCTVCGITFHRKKGTSISLWEKRKTCSRECHYKRMKSHRIGFKVGHSGFKNKTNFKKGYIPWNKGKKNTASGASIDALKGYIKKHGSHNKGKKVSEETRAKIKLARAKQDMSNRSGPNHHNWKGGVTKIQNSVRELSIYRDWRHSVFLRDDWTCQHCNKRGGRLNADHIKSFSKILNDNNIKTIEQAKSCTELWDLSNGRTLCNLCHFKTDTYGAKSIIKS